MCIYRQHLCTCQPINCSQIPARKGWENPKGEIQWSLQLNGLCIPEKSHGELGSPSIPPQGCATKLFSFFLGSQRALCQVLPSSSFPALYSRMSLPGSGCCGAITTYKSGLKPRQVLGKWGWPGSCQLLAWGEQEASRAVLPLGGNPSSDSSCLWGLCHADLSYPSRAKHVAGIGNFTGMPFCGNSSLYCDVIQSGANEKLYQLYSCQLPGCKDCRELLGNSLAPPAVEPRD